MVDGGEYASRPFPFSSERSPVRGGAARTSSLQRMGGRGRGGVGECLPPCCERSLIKTPDGVCVALP